jgi:hypothetical protein
MPKAPFYSLYNVGPYTLAPFKVVWKGLAKGSIATVCETIDDPYIGQKPIIPEHNTMLVDFEELKEAHYFCALLNSCIFSFVLQSYIAWFYSTHALQNIRIPKYDPANPLHQELAALSQRAHELAAAGQPIERIKPIEEEIDRKAAQLWGLTDEELVGIKASLKELS